MGKVKRKDQKNAQNLGKSKQITKKLKKNVDIAKLVPVVKKNIKTNGKLSDNIFYGLNINLGSSKGSVNKQSGTKATKAISSKETRKNNSFIGSRVEKKYKRKIKSARQRKKHQVLMKKIGSIQADEKAEEDQKKREKTKIVGDLHPMLNALPSLEELLANTKKETKESKTKPRTKKLKARQTDLMNDFKLMMAVNKDKIYTDDPFGCVAKAVQNRILYEQEDLQQK